MKDAERHIIKIQEELCLWNEAEISSDDLCRKLFNTFVDISYYRKFMEIRRKKLKKEWFQKK